MPPYTLFIVNSAASSASSTIIQSATTGVGIADTTISHEFSATEVKTIAASESVSTFLHPFPVLALSSAGLFFYDRPSPSSDMVRTTHTAHLLLGGVWYICLLGSEKFSDLSKLIDRLPCESYQSI